jgi:hypothetical protein
MDRKSDENRSFGANKPISAISSNTSAISADSSKLGGAKNHSHNMERVQRLIDSLADFAAQEIRQDLARVDGLGKGNHPAPENGQIFQIYSAILGASGRYDQPAPPALLIKGNFDQPAATPVSLELLQSVDARLGTIAVSTAYGAAAEAHSAARCLRTPHAGFITTGNHPKLDSGIKAQPRQFSNAVVRVALPSQQANNNQLSAVRINKILAEALAGGQRKSSDTGIFNNLKDVIKIVDFGRFREKKEAPAPQIVSSGNVRPRYVVQPQDTPAAIAKSIFGDSRFADLIITINRAAVFYEQSQSGWQPRIPTGSEICLPSESEREIYGRNYFKKKANDFLSRFGSFAAQSKSKRGAAFGGSYSQSNATAAGHAQSPALDAPAFLQGLRFVPDQSAMQLGRQNFKPTAANAQPSWTPADQGDSAKNWQPAITPLPFRGEEAFFKPLEAPCEQSPSPSPSPSPTAHKAQCQPVDWNSNNQQPASNHIVAAPNVPSLRRAAFSLNHGNLVQRVAAMEEAVANENALPYIDAGQIGNEAGGTPALQSEAGGTPALQIGVEAGGTPALQIGVEAGGTPALQSGVDAGNGEGNFQAASGGDNLISFEPTSDTTDGGINSIQRILTQVRFSGDRHSLNLDQFESSCPNIERQIYTVLPGETLHAVAAKDPYLQDAIAWKLLATINGLPVECDPNGLPVATLFSGQQLVLATEEEGAQYRMLTKLSAVADQSQTIKGAKSEFTKLLSPNKEKAEEKFKSSMLAANCRLLVREDDINSSRFCLKLQASIANIWFTLVTYESSVSHTTVRHVYSQNGSISYFALELPLTVARQMAEEDLRRNWPAYLNAYLATSFNAERKDGART